MGIAETNTPLNQLPAVELRFHPLKQGIRRFDQITSLGQVCLNIRVPDIQIVKERDTVNGGEVARQSSYQPFYFIRVGQSKKLVRPDLPPGSVENSEEERLPIDLDCNLVSHSAGFGELEGPNADMLGTCSIVADSLVFTVNCLSLDSPPGGYSHFAHGVRKHLLEALSSPWRPLSTEHARGENSTISTATP